MRHILKMKGLMLTALLLSVSPAHALSAQTTTASDEDVEVVEIEADLLKSQNKNQMLELIKASELPTKVSLDPEELPPAPLVAPENTPVANEVESTDSNTEVATTQPATADLIMSSPSEDLTIQLIRPAGPASPQIPAALAVPAVSTGAQTPASKQATEMTATGQEVAAANKKEFKITLQPEKRSRKSGKSHQVRDPASVDLDAEE